MKNQRFREILEGLQRLPEQAETVEVERWIYPYDWLLDCEKMCGTILNFLPGT